jgi:hypothetical protein
MGSSTSRTALSLASFLTFVTICSAQPPKILAPHDAIAPKVKKPVPEVPVPGSIAGGPWIVDGNFKSAMYLKNVVETSAITVTPILYLSNGAKYQLPPVQIEPSGTAIVDINSSLQNLGIAPYATLSGWVELQYTWPWTPLCAMIRAVDVAHSLIFSFGFEAPGPLSSPASQKSNSQVTEGMWWKQEPNVNGFLTLANTTSQAITAVVQVSDNRAALLGTHTITVSPQGMKTLNLQELQTATTTEGGIRIKYVGQPDALLISGALQDSGVGYSATLHFAPPARPLPPMARATTQRGIAALGLMTGAADPMMRFPAGTTFTPYTVVRNVSTGPISVSPTLWWMQGGAPASFQLAQFSLLPGQTHTVDFSSLLASAGLKNFNGSVNLVFDTQGKSGLLIGAGSVDQTNTYVFEVAPHGVVNSAGKSISYWSTANGDDTMISLWNPADEAQDFIFRVMFSGGHYDFPIQLGPRATRMFNISEIIASQVPDAQGNIIPASIQEGSAKIVGSHADNEHILVVADGGTYNVRKATCGLFCFSCDGATSYSVDLNPFGVGVGANTQESLTAHWSSGGQYNVTSGSSWNSSDTGKATVQTGLVHGVAVGSFVLSGGTGSEPDYTSGCYPEGMSCPIAQGGGGNSPGNTKPIITSIDPTIAMIGSNSVQLTINGSGFGTSPTVNLPTGFTSSGQGASDTRIVITVNIGFTATVGNNNITVTNSATSDPATFQVDGPYHMVVQSDVTGKCSGCATTVERFVTYQIQNFSGTNAGATWIGEVVTDTGWSCTQSNPGSSTAPCSANQQTNSTGVFTDGWSLASDGYTPTGCGENTTDQWQWCKHTPAQDLGTLTGYLHTNAIKINGVVSPSAMPTGTVIPF